MKVDKGKQARVKGVRKENKYVLERTREQNMVKKLSPCNMRGI